MSHFLRLLLGVACLGLTRTLAQNTPIPGSRLITPAVSFLMLDSEARSLGFGSITAVAPTGYFASGLDGNPATLAQGNRSVGGFVNYSPWLGFINSQIHVGQAGGWLSLGPHHTLGIQVNGMSIGGGLTGSGGAPRGNFRQREGNLGIRYAMALSPMVSMGLGINLFRSVEEITGLRPSRRQSASADWGLWLHQENHDRALGNHWQVGISIQDLGPKIEIHRTTILGFIPTRLKIGGLFGLRIHDQVDLDFAYQAQKLLIPSNGAPQEVSALTGLFGSFSDSQEGMLGEWQEIRHHVGLEQRWRHQGWWVAIREGYTYEHPTLGNRQTLDFGASLGFLGIRFDAGFSHYLNLRNAGIDRPGIWTFSLVSAFGK